MHSDTVFGSEEDSSGGRPAPRTVRSPVDPKDFQRITDEYRLKIEADADGRPVLSSQVNAAPSVPLLLPRSALHAMSSMKSHPSSNILSSSEAAELEARYLAQMQQKVEADASGHPSKPSASIGSSTHLSAPALPPRPTPQAMASAGQAVLPSRQSWNILSSSEAAALEAQRRAEMQEAEVREKIEADASGRPCKPSASMGSRPNIFSAPALPPRPTPQAMESRSRGDDELVPSELDSLRSRWPNTLPCSVAAMVDECLQKNLSPQRLAFLEACVAETLKACLSEAQDIDERQGDTLCALMRLPGYAEKILEEVLKSIEKNARVVPSLFELFSRLLRQHDDLTHTDFARIIEVFDGVLKKLDASASSDSIARVLSHLHEICILFLKKGISYDIPALGALVQTLKAIRNQHGALVDWRIRLVEQAKMRLPQAYIMSELFQRQGLSILDRATKWVTQRTDSITQSKKSLTIQSVWSAVSGAGVEKNLSDYDDFLVVRSKYLETLGNGHVESFFGAYLPSSDRLSFFETKAFYLVGLLDLFAQSVEHSVAWDIQRVTDIGVLVRSIFMSKQESFKMYRALMLDLILDVSVHLRSERRIVWLEATLVPLLYDIFLDQASSGERAQLISHEVLKAQKKWSVLRKNPKFSSSAQSILEATQRSLAQRKENRAVFEQHVLALKEAVGGFELEHRSVVSKVPFDSGRWLEVSDRHRVIHNIPDCSGWLWRSPIEVQDLLKVRNRVISGAPGSGKTVLTKLWISRLVAQGDLGVCIWVVDARTRQEIEQGLQSLREALGSSPGSIALNGDQQAPSVLETWQQITDLIVNRSHAAPSLKKNALIIFENVCQESEVFPHLEAIRNVQSSAITFYTWCTSGLSLQSCGSCLSLDSGFSREDAWLLAKHTLKNALVRDDFEKVFSQTHSKRDWIDSLDHWDDKIKAVPETLPSQAQKEVPSEASLPQMSRKDQVRQMIEELECLLSGDPQAFWNDERRFLIDDKKNGHSLLFEVLSESPKIFDPLCSRDAFFEDDRKSFWNLWYTEEGARCMIHLLFRVFTGKVSSNFSQILLSDLRSKEAMVAHPRSLLCLLSGTHEGIVLLKYLLKRQPLCFKGLFFREDFWPHPRDRSAVVINLSISAPGFLLRDLYVYDRLNNAGAIFSGLTLDDFLCSVPGSYSLLCYLMESEEGVAWLREIQSDQPDFFKILDAEKHLLSKPKTRACASKTAFQACISHRAGQDFLYQLHTQPRFGCSGFLDRIPARAFLDAEGSRKYGERPSPLWWCAYESSGRLILKALDSKRRRQIYQEIDESEDLDHVPAFLRDDLLNLKGESLRTLLKNSPEGREFLDEMIDERPDLDASDWDQRVSLRVPPVLRAQTWPSILPQLQEPWVNIPRPDVAVCPENLKVLVDELLQEVSSEAPSFQSRRRAFLEALAVRALDRLSLQRGFSSFDHLPELLELARLDKFRGAVLEQLLRALERSLLSQQRLLDAMLSYVRQTARYLEVPHILRILRSVNAQMLKLSSVTDVQHLKQALKTTREILSLLSQKMHARHQEADLLALEETLNDLGGKHPEAPSIGVYTELARQALLRIPSEKAWSNIFSKHASKCAEEALNLVGGAMSLNPGTLLVSVLGLGFEIGKIYNEVQKQKWDQAYDALLAAEQSLQSVVEGLPSIFDLRGQSSAPVQSYLQGVMPATYDFPRLVEEQPLLIQGLLEIFVHAVEEGMVHDVSLIEHVAHIVRELFNVKKGVLDFKRDLRFHALDVMVRVLEVMESGNKKIWWDRTLRPLLLEFFSGDEKHSGDRFQALVKVFSHRWAFHSNAVLASASKLFLPWANQKYSIRKKERPKLETLLEEVLKGLMSIAKVSSVSKEVPPPHWGWDSIQRGYAVVHNLSRVWPRHGVGRMVVPYSDLLDKNIFVYGPQGSGKSFLMDLWASEMIYRGDVTAFVWCLDARNPKFLQRSFDQLIDTLGLRSKLIPFNESSMQYPEYLDQAYGQIFESLMSLGQRSGLLIFENLNESTLHWALHHQESCQRAQGRGVFFKTYVWGTGLLALPVWGPCLSLDRLLEQDPAMACEVATRLLERPLNEKEKNKWGHSDFLASFSSIREWVAFLRTWSQDSVWVEEEERVSSQELVPGFNLDTLESAILLEKDVEKNRDLDVQACSILPKAPSVKVVLEDDALAPECSAPMFQEPSDVERLWALCDRLDVREHAAFKGLLEQLSEARPLLQELLRVLTERLGMWEFHEEVHIGQVIKNPWVKEFFLLIYGFEPSIFEALFKTKSEESSKIPSEAGGSSENAATDEITEPLCVEAREIGKEEADLLLVCQSASSLLRYCQRYPHVPISPPMRWLGSDELPVQEALFYEMCFHRDQHDQLRELCLLQPRFLETLTLEVLRLRSHSAYEDTAERMSALWVLSSTEQGCKVLLMLHEKMPDVYSSLTVEDLGESPSEGRYRGVSTRDGLMQYGMGRQLMQYVDASCPCLSWYLREGPLEDLYTMHSSHKDLWDRLPVRSLYAVGASGLSLFARLSMTHSGRDFLYRLICERPDLFATDMLKRDDLFQNISSKSETGETVFRYLTKDLEGCAFLFNLFAWAGDRVVLKPMNLSKVVLTPISDRIRWVPSVEHLLSAPQGASSAFSRLARGYVGRLWIRQYFKEHPDDLEAIRWEHLFEPGGSKTSFSYLSESENGSAFLLSLHKKIPSFFSHQLTSEHLFSSPSEGADRGKNNFWRLSVHAAGREFLSSLWSGGLNVDVQLTWLFIRPHAALPTVAEHLLKDRDRSRLFSSFFEAWGGTRIDVSDRSIQSFWQAWAMDPKFPSIFFTEALFKPFSQLSWSSVLFVDEALRRATQEQRALWFIYLAKGKIRWAPSVGHLLSASQGTSSAFSRLARGGYLTRLWIREYFKEHPHDLEAIRWEHLFEPGEPKTSFSYLSESENGSPFLRSLQKKMPTFFSHQLTSEHLFSSPSEGADRGKNNFWRLSVHPAGRKFLSRLWSGGLNVDVQLTWLFIRPHAALPTVAEHLLEDSDRSRLFLSFFEAWGAARVDVSDRSIESFWQAWAMDPKFPSIFFTKALFEPFSQVSFSVLFVHAALRRATQEQRALWFGYLAKERWGQSFLETLLARYPTVFEGLRWDDWGVASYQSGYTLFSWLMKEAGGQSFLQALFERCPEIFSGVRWDHLVSSPEQGATLLECSSREWRGQHFIAELLKCHPNTFEGLRWDQLVQGVTLLECFSREWSGQYFLGNLLECYPNTFEGLRWDHVITSTAQGSRVLECLSKEDWGRSFLEALLKRYPEAFEGLRWDQLVQGVTLLECFSREWSGRYFLGNLLECHPNTFEGLRWDHVITSTAQGSRVLECLSKEDWGRSFLKALLKRYPEAFEHLRWDQVVASPDQGPTLLECFSKEWRGRYFLAELLKCHPNTFEDLRWDQLVQGVTLLECFSREWSGRYFLGAFLERYPEAFEGLRWDHVITSTAQGSRVLGCLSKEHWGRSFLEALLKRYPEAFEHLRWDQVVASPDAGSTLLGYLLKEEGGQWFLQLLLNKRPQVFSEVHWDHVVTSPDQGLTLLGGLSKEERGQRFLESLLERYPEAFEHLRWNHVVTSPDQGATLLGYLSKGEWGQSFLEALLEKRPQVFSGVHWNSVISSPEQGVTLLESFSSYGWGRWFLETFLEQSPGAFDGVRWNQPIASEQGATLLRVLSRDEFGQSFLKALLKHDPQAFEGLRWDDVLTFPEPSSRGLEYFSRYQWGQSFLKDLLHYRPQFFEGLRWNQVMVLPDQASIVLEHFSKTWWGRWLLKGFLERYPQVFEGFLWNQVPTLPDQGAILLGCFASEWWGQQFLGILLKHRPQAFEGVRWDSVVASPQQGVTLLGCLSREAWGHAFLKSLLAHHPGIFENLTPDAWTVLYHQGHTLWSWLTKDESGRSLLEFLLEKHPQVFSGLRWDHVVASPEEGSTLLGCLSREAWGHSFLKSLLEHHPGIFENLTPDTWTVLYHEDDSFLVWLMKDGSGRSLLEFLLEKHPQVFSGLRWDSVVASPQQGVTLLGCLSREAWGHAFLKSLLTRDPSAFDRVTWASWVGLYSEGSTLLSVLMEDASGQSLLETFLEKRPQVFSGLRWDEVVALPEHGSTFLGCLVMGRWGRSFLESLLKHRFAFFEPLTWKHWIASHQGRPLLNRLLSQREGWKFLDTLLERSPEVFEGLEWHHVFPPQGTGDMLLEALAREQVGLWFLKTLVARHPQVFKRLSWADWLRPYGDHGHTLLDWLLETMSGLSLESWVKHCSSTFENLSWEALMSPYRSGHTLVSYLMRNQAGRSLLIGLMKYCPHSFEGSQWDDALMMQEQNTMVLLDGVSEWPAEAFVEAWLEYCPDAFLGLKWDRLIGPQEQSATLLEYCAREPAGQRFLKRLVESRPQVFEGLSLRQWIAPYGQAGHTLLSWLIKEDSGWLLLDSFRNSPATPAKEASHPKRPAVNREYSIPVF